MTAGIGTGWLGTGRLGTGRLRAELAGALAALAGWACLWWPLLVGAERLFVRDLWRFALPSKHFLQESLAAGQLPLWTPWLGAGQPWLADLAHQAFYPPNLVYLAAVATGAAPAAALTAFVLAHSLLALVGMRVLLGCLGTPLAVAWLLALAWAASGVGVSVTDNVTYLAGFTWLPFALAALLRLLASEPPARPLAGLAVAFALLLLAGDLLDAGLLLGASLLLVLLVPPADGQPAIGVARRLLRAAAALALGLLLAAVQLLPTLDLLALGERVDGLSLAAARQWSLPPPRLLEFAAPFVFGAKYPLRDFMAPGLYPQAATPWFESLYLGLPLLLAALAAAVARRREALPWLLLLLFATLLALGRHAPLHAWAHAWLPLFDTQRYPEKLAVWLTLLLVVLAGLGAAPLAALLRRLRASSSRRDLLARLAASVALAVGCLLLLAELPTKLLPAEVLASPSAYWRVRTGLDLGWLQGALLHALVLGLALAALPWLARRAPRRAAVALFAVAALDLLWLHAGHAPAMPAALADEPAPPVVVAHLSSRPGARVFVEPAPADGDDLPRGEVTRRLLAVHGDETRALLAGAQWMRSSLLEREHLQPDTNVLASVPVLATGVSPLAPSLQADRVGGEPGVATLAAAGVEHVLAAPGRAAALAAVGLERVAADLPGGAVLMRVPGAAPYVDLEGEGAGTARLLEHAPGRITVAVTSGRGARLVVRESWHPGWRALLDGQVAGTPARGPAGMLALNVPAGRHELRFVYTERRLAAGALATGAGLVALAWLLLGAPRSGRGRSLAGAGPLA